MKISTYPLMQICLTLAACFSVLSPHPMTAADFSSEQGFHPDLFMKNWLVLKPIPDVPESKRVPTDEERKRAFLRDFLAAAGGEACVRPTVGTRVTIEGSSYTWQAILSTNDSVDLTQSSNPAEYVSAYAWAEIDVKKATEALLGIGSDDSVRVWLNGNLVHENWTSRGVELDNDIVRLVFQRGKNHLLLKIQNGIGPWGFSCRVMGPESQARKMIGTIMNSGDNESLQKFIDSGLDINSRTKAGMTPWLAARLRGQTELAEFLAGKGANTNVSLPKPAKLLDSMFQTVIKSNGPGAAVLVARNGKVLFEKGYGLADVEHQRPVNAETKFRIGSISKQFTAAAILKLQEEGKLSVDDKLSKYFPNYPRGDEVKLRHLLTHTSGIHNYTSKPGFIDSVSKPITPDSLVESFRNDSFDFDPGKQWSYCNSGFFLLGCIVEKVSGQAYDDFLRRTFFEPLGMKNTGVHHSDLSLTNVALGYDGGPKRAINWDMSWAGGAGALYSTVGDLYRWNEAVFHNKVLKRASLQAAFTPVKTSSNQEEGGAGYGFGWAISKFRGAPEISHGGGLNGFTSALLRLTDQNLTVVVLVNGAPNAEPQSLAHYVAEVCVGTELEPRPKALKVSSRDLELFVGRYDYGQAVMTVQREGNRLFAQLAFQPRFEIFPKSESEFFWKVTDAQVTFMKGSDGRIIEALHRQNGATIHAPRLAELKIAKVDPAFYDAIVGKYKIDGTEIVATLTKEDNRLFGEMPGQPKLELLPTSETDFGLREVNAQITFVKDASGKVTKAKLMQSGQTTEATKLN